MQITTLMLDGSAASVAATGAIRLVADLGGAPTMVVVFASTKQPLAEVLNGLRAALPDTTVLGCSTAGELTEKGDAKGHTALFAVRGDLKVHAGYSAGLKADAEAAVVRAAAPCPATVEGYPHKTAMIFLDALSGVSEEVTLLAADALGGEVRLAGGAAGDDLAMKAPLVGLGGDSGADSVVIATLFTKAPLGVGVCHGHRNLSGPLTITRSVGATVFEVDGRPAWDVWREQTAAAAKADGIDVDALTDDTVIGFLLQFEAGLDTGNDVPKIRAPLSRGSDGSLSFACGIPEGSVIRITESAGDQQISSAREAALRARAQMGGGEVAGALVFDCICRNLILKDRFGLAVAGMTEALGNAPLAGFESYGEVALDAGDFSGFHNTTTVVLAFPK